MDIIFYFSKVINITFLLSKVALFSLSTYIIGTFIFTPYRVGYFRKHKIHDDHL
jgi:hypothetical protein